MEEFREFAYEAISALRPVLYAEALDHVGFAIEEDRLHHTVIAAVSGELGIESWFRLGLPVRCAIAPWMVFR
ncbi:hypothetical protein B2J88_49800 [Rhodococcus sp. SRB_17]|nr:hypothetical protein [Rhodococcus sp. SRB_17]